MKKFRLMIVGHGRHGKDSVCEILRDSFGLSFISSSWAAAEVVVYNKLRKSFGYTSVQQCFDDRHNHRDLWYNIIKEYNTPNKTKLMEHIYSKADIYCGIRDREEFLEGKRKGIFDTSIWVDASDRLPPEPLSSCSVLPEDADFVLDNNGPESELMVETCRVMYRVAYIHPHVNNHVRQHILHILDGKDREK